MSALDLFDAVGLAPSLPGAKCRGRHRLFDPPNHGVEPGEAEYAERAAQRLCSVCPALVRCAAWFESLPPSRRPLGVVAGRVNRPRPVGRPRRTA
ncbi:hypothetical protein Mycch_2203 [Mycolicibacterium chubuense NBB4]|uniref:4Fe-4S Wbl-type domain-containing protein n=1 Tax=Mycolicibacterium chubuense (strain NBB4) TaxID=710421 RepID=I4BI79_MYCCN|nr:hypothetical protein Mycch_2203 [Mycolicibacterium chubuense NBB4]